MPETVIYFAPNSHRSKLVANALMTGAKGLDVEMRSSRSFREVDSKRAVFYGMSEGLAAVLRAYSTSAKAQACFVDLGYWQRRSRSRWDGFHKIVANGRHPTDYFQATPRNAGRLSVHSIDIRPWRDEGRHIIVAGMSAKAAAAEGLRPEEWERAAIAQLRKLTKRQIIYRPKPNWYGAKSIIGSTMDAKTPLLDAFVDCHAVVTHHSNVAVDALIAGIPCICPYGVASRLSSHDLADIENPRMALGREQWAADLAHTQYSIAEMADGKAWDYIINDLGALA